MTSCVLYMVEELRRLSNGKKYKKYTSIVAYPVFVIWDFFRPLNGCCFEMLFRRVYLSQRGMYPRGRATSSSYLEPT